MINYQNYCGFNDLVRFEKTIYNVVSSIDWRVLKLQLLSNPKELDNNRMWWYVVQGNDHQVFFESNLESIVDSSSDCPLTEESEYLQIDLTEGCTPELVELKNCMVTLPGVLYIGVHFLSPNSYIETHIDTDTVNVLFHIKTSKGGKLIIEDKEFNFQDRQVFAFDGNLPHSVENKFGTDWIMFVLRISKNSFC
jgi:hypothetical protein